MLRMNTELYQKHCKITIKYGESNVCSGLINADWIRSGLTNFGSGLGIVWVGIGIFLV